MIAALLLYALAPAYAQPPQADARFSLVCALRRGKFVSTDGSVHPDEGAKPGVFALSFKRPTTHFVEVATIETLDEANVLQGGSIVEFSIGPNVSGDRDTLGLFADTHDGKKIAVLGTLNRDTKLWRTSVITTQAPPSKGIVKDEAFWGSCSVVPAKEQSNLVALLRKDAK